MLDDRSNEADEANNQRSAEISPFVEGDLRTPSAFMLRPNARVGDVPRIPSVPNDFGFYCRGTVMTAPGVWARSSEHEFMPPHCGPIVDVE